LSPDGPVGRDSSQARPLAVTGLSSRAIPRDGAAILDDRVFRLRHELVTTDTRCCDEALPWSPPTPMFSGFDIRTDADATRRYTITTVVAAGVLVGLVGVAFAFSGGEKDKEEEPEVIDVTFQAPAAEEAPPKPIVPEPPPAVKKLAKSDGPKPPTKAPETPTKISDEVLEESDESKFRVADTGGSEDGEMVVGADVGGVPGGLGKAAPPPPPKPKAEKKVAKSGPIMQPENATVPKPMGGNALPAYPEDARSAGLEGDVFLKIVINEDGSVGDIEVKKGDEPFVSAAIAAVKTWKYSPALLDGKPIAVYRVIKVPFKLKA
jgi:protein TonB